MSLRIVAKSTLRFFIGIDAVDFTWCAQTTHQNRPQGSTQGLYASYHFRTLKSSFLGICPDWKDSEGRYGSTAEWLRSLRSNFHRKPWGVPSAMSCVHRSGDYPEYSGFLFQVRA